MVSYSRVRFHVEKRVETERITPMNWSHVSGVVFAAVAFAAAVAWAQGDAPSIGTDKTVGVCKRTEVVQLAVAYKEVI